MPSRNQHLAKRPFNQDKLGQTNQKLNGLVEFYFHVFYYPFIVLVVYCEGTCLFQLSLYGGTR
jgi:hypothetical protein